MNTSDYVEAIAESLIKLTEKGVLTWERCEQGCRSSIGEEGGAVTIELIPVGNFEGTLCCYLRFSKHLAGVRYNMLRDSSASSIYILIPRKNSRASVLIENVSRRVSFEKRTAILGDFGAEHGTFGSRLLEILQSSDWKESRQYFELSSRLAECGLWPQEDSVLCEFNTDLCSVNDGSHIRYPIKMISWLHETFLRGFADPIYCLTIICSDLTKFLILREASKSFASSVLYENNISGNVCGLEVFILPGSDPLLIAGCRRLLQNSERETFRNLVRLCNIGSDPVLPKAITSMIGEINAEEKLKLAIAGLRPLSDDVRQSEKDASCWLFGDTPNLAV